RISGARTDDRHATAGCRDAVRYRLDAITHVALGAGIGRPAEGALGEFLPEGAPLDTRREARRYGAAQGLRQTSPIRERGRQHGLDAPADCLAQNWRGAVRGDADDDGRT